MGGELWNQSNMRQGGLAYRVDVESDVKEFLLVQVISPIEYKGGF